MSLLVLPRTTILPLQPIVRRHRPEGGSYRTYLSCLRWEFGFSCAFCFLHESDLTSIGGFETQLFDIEHFTPISTDTSRAADYTNLFYACQFCNRARGNAREVSPDGSRLLNPCEQAWGDHFQLKENQMLPRPGDRDATYTAEVFDFNDPRRQAARDLRRKVVGRSLEVLERAKEWESRLLDRAQEAETLELAELLTQMRRLAFEDLSRFAAIPLDADRSCACGASETSGLPGWLAEQCLEI